MNNKERIVSFLATSEEICDDCLSESTGVRPRQTVYAICRELSNSYSIKRRNGKCVRCRKIKLVNLLTKESSLERTELLSPNYGEGDDSERKVNWFWEGNVQARVIMNISLRNNIHAVTHFYTYLG